MRIATVTALGLTLAAVVAHADAHLEVTGDVAAGAGTDTTSRSVATALAALGVAYARAPVPLERRGLVLGDDSSGTSRLWLFTNTDADDRDAIRADVSALALRTTREDTQVQHGDGLPGAGSGAGWRRGTFDAGLSARGAGWSLGGRIAYQPVGSLRDPYWRSGRDVTTSTVAFSWPAAFTFGTADSRTAFGGLDVSFVSRARLDVDLGMDVDVALRFMRYQSAQTTVDLFRFHDIEFDGPGHGATLAASNTEANDIAVDFAAVDYHLFDHLVLSTHAGIEVMHPLATFTHDGSSGTGTLDGGQLTTARYGLALTEHRAHATFGAGAGSWARLDPTGGGADIGQLVTASADWTHRRIELRGDLQLGRLRRGLLGPLAPANLAPVGTSLDIGRGSIEADVHLVRKLVVASTAWVERSDRDDPRWSVPANGELATHAGADVSARWSFR